jgi:hypothetical protein
MQKEKMRLVYLTINGYTILAVLAITLIAFDLLALEQNITLSWVLILLKNGLPYLLGALVLSAIASNLKIIYEGTFVPAIFNALTGITIGFIAYFVCTIGAFPLQIHTLSIYIFILVALSSTYYLVNKILQIQQQIIPISIARFTILTCMGITLRFAALALGESVILTNILLFGFLFGGATTLFYPLRYSKKSYAKKMGTSIGAGTVTKVVLFVILGVIIASYALLLRPYLAQTNENMTLIGEWMFIGIMTAASFLLLRKKLNAISGPIILANWIKHTQELDFKTSPEVNALSDAIDNFLQTGDKNAITWFLYDFLTQQKVQHRQIYSTLTELFNFQNKPTPHLIFSWDYPLLQESEKIRRKETIENIIKKLNPELFRSNQGDK